MNANITNQEYYKITKDTQAGVHAIWGNSTEELQLLELTAVVSFTTLCKPYK